MTTLVTVGMRLSLGLLAVSTTFAQGNLGGLAGTILDMSGANIPAAKVTLRNLDTNQIQTTESREAGYVFQGVPPGTYSLEVEKAGFKKAVRERLTILTATQTELNITLELG